MTQASNTDDGFEERRVTYTLEMDGRFYLIENVPVRVDLQTGEELYSPQTVEQLYRTIRGGGKPVRVIETPVFQFSG